MKVKKIIASLFTVITLLSSFAIPALAAEPINSEISSVVSKARAVVYYQWETEDDGWDCHTYQLRWRVNGNFWTFTGRTRYVNKRPWCNH